MDDNKSQRSYFSIPEDGSGSESDNDTETLSRAQLFYEYKELDSEIRGLITQLRAGVNDILIPKMGQIPESKQDYFGKYYLSLQRKIDYAEVRLNQFASLINNPRDPDTVESTLRNWIVALEQMAYDLNAELDKIAEWAAWAPSPNPRR